jgi:hypothetical protein
MKDRSLVDCCLEPNKNLQERVDIAAIQRRMTTTGGMCGGVLANCERAGESFLRKHTWRERIELQDREALEVKEEVQKTLQMRIWGLWDVLHKMAEI